MEKKCRGCGITLQDQDKGALGYVVSMDMDYCQRCYRLTHYDDHPVKDFVPDNEQILSDLSCLEGQFVWVMDIFDLETSLRCSLSRFYQEHECIVILNKCDLLPENINLAKRAGYVLERIRALDIRSSAIITRGINDDFLATLDSVRNVGKPLIMTGAANVGKSTIINEILGEKIATTNPYPATTMRINEITNDRITIYDSAGLWMNDSMQACLNVNDLKRVVPHKTVRPTVYQLEGGQSLSLGGLVRVDLSFEGRCSAVTYLSNQLKVHRGKKENAERFWKSSFGKDELRPVPVAARYPEDYKHVHFIHEGKADYFICGLGFITLTGDRGEVDVYLPATVQIIKRKAMI